MLRSALHQPGLYDPPNLKKKMSLRPIVRLMSCLQDYFEHCARIVANEQEYIGAKIKDVGLTSFRDYFSINCFFSFTLFVL